MPRLLSPQEAVLLQKDTDYLNTGIGIWQSRVVDWNGRFILIYRSETEGYIPTDITDLGQVRIQALVEQSEIHGIWYYLPSSIASVISDAAEETIDAIKEAGGGITEIAQSTATAIGQTVANLTKPIVDTLAIPLILGVAIGLIYLMKKG